MVKIKLGAPIESVTGKLAGSSFKVQKGVQTLQNIGNRKPIETNYNQLFRQVVSSVRTAWPSLSQAERNIWNNTTLQKRTGIDLFIRQNFWRVFRGMTIIKTPSFLQFLASPATVAPIVASGGVIINVAYPVEDGQRIIVMATRNSISQGVNKSPKNYRFAGEFELTNFGIPMDLTSFLNNNFSHQVNRGVMFTKIITLSMDRTTALPDYHLRINTAI